MSLEKPHPSFVPIALNAAGDALTLPARGVRRVERGKEPKYFDLPLEGMEDLPLGKWPAIDWHPVDDLATVSELRPKPVVALGLHAACAERFELWPFDDGNRAIVCPKCRVIAVVPKAVGTYRELRAQFAAVQPKRENALPLEEGDVSVPRPAGVEEVAAALDAFVPEKRAFSFVPIVLTEEGDRLALPAPKPLLNQRAEEVPSQLDLPADLDALPLGEYPFEEMRSNDPESYGASMFRAEGKMLGDHAVCGHRLSLVKISATYRAIACARCALRVLLPMSVVTYGDLRAHLRNLQPSP